MFLIHSKKLPNFPKHCFLFWLVLLLIQNTVPQSLFAQCQTLDIDISKKTLCIGENFDIEVVAPDLEPIWDFCPGDIVEESASVLQVATLPNSDRSLGMSIVKSDEGWFGFATSRDNNSIIRFFFGDGVQNPPTLTDNLGNIQSLLNQPSSIQVFERDGNWYAFVHNWAGKNLVLLSFGNSLSSSPAGEEWVSNIGASNSFLDIAITEDSVTAIVTNSNATLSIVNIPSQLDTKPSITDRIEIGTLTGVNTLMDIELVNGMDLLLL